MSAPYTEKKERRRFAGSVIGVWVITSLILSIARSGYASAGKFYPVFARGYTQCLNGDWSFKYLPGLDAGSDGRFFEPTFEVFGWQTIRVPSNWELKGFAEPYYNLRLQDGLGLYRRAFWVPDAWRDGRRVCLRFEGVAFGFEAWVNGTKIGQSRASAYNPITFDITDALRAESQGENLLAVKVTTKPLGYEFDVNDDWSLSGIFRDVTLFSIPAIHLQDFTATTTLADDGTASVSVVAVVDNGDANVHATVIGPSGETMREFDLAKKTNGIYQANISIANPQLWTAETPALYRVQLSLSTGGKPLQSIDERIGLREVSIRDRVLRLNGAPIKLRGVNHHDLDPVDGRAITEPEMRRDLELMKRGNINFVRTSHYPANEKLIELCDELGFYVLDEVSIGKGEEHDNDPAYRDNIMARAEDTITRDKNHASVIVWSIGNENPVTDLLLEAGRYAKQLDPSRPICFPMTPTVFKQNYGKLPEYVDIYSPHYPSNSELRNWAQTVDRPLILTEYAHALGLAADRIQDQWEILQNTPQFAGGAIWHFMDQGLLRRSEKPVNINKPVEAVWMGEYSFYDTHGVDGVDGIVYSDRTPQTDFWETRKVYSPIQIPERSTRVEPGHNNIYITVQNRYDFCSLAGSELGWSLRRNGTELRYGTISLEAPAHGVEKVSTAVDIPAVASGDFLSLNITCFNKTGMAVNERAIKLERAQSPVSEWLANRRVVCKPRVLETATGVKVESADWVLTVERLTGALKVRDLAGHLLVAGVYPHSGRKFTMSDRRNSTRMNLWPNSALVSNETPSVRVLRKTNSVVIQISGRYPRRGDPQQAFLGGYSAEITPEGSIVVTYDFQLDHAEGTVSEAGLSVLLPKELTEFQWVGQGPYPGYPGKDRLNEFGLFHLNREDLHFQGNRRETEIALMTAPAGIGIALAPIRAADVAVERDGEQILLSHNAVIGGLGNKGWPPETTIDVAKTTHISGSFTLIPLKDVWPGELVRWFGKPAMATKVFHPFYQSYDQ